jgi:hypothetical protein
LDFRPTKYTTRVTSIGKGESFEDYLLKASSNAKQADDRTIGNAENHFSGSAFYKGESQEKKLPGDWKDAHMRLKLIVALLLVFR